MAFGNQFNGYPGFYNPGYPAVPYQQFQSQQPQAPQQSNGIIWVQGESGAKAYSMAPGQTAMLMDSENHRFYIKTVDASGMPSLRAFDFVERTAEAAEPIKKEDYVTRAEFAALEDAVKAMKGGMQNAEPTARNPRGR